MATTLQHELLPEVELFLARDRFGGFIGGKEVDAERGQTLEAFNPGDGSKLATVASFQPHDVDRAVDAAVDTFQKSQWAKMPANERSALLHRLADAVEKRKSIIAQIEALDCGKLVGQAESDVQMFIDTMRYYADLAQHIQQRQVLAVKGHDAWIVRHAWGACGFIIPWNFPFLLAGWGIAPALAAGNTVVIKPAEDTPMSTLYLAQLVNEVGIPPGVVNVCPGFGENAGAALAMNPRLKRLSFTGSPEVGRLVAEAGARNLIPVKCELGGKGAAVVFDDVEVAKTAQSLVDCITFHAGQVCCDATRWLVHKKIYDQFIDECVIRMKAVEIGHPLDERAQMGPVISEKQRRRILNYLDKGVAEGAELVLEGGAHKVSGCEQGIYVKPALLAGKLSNVAAREEIFGPVAFVAPFSSEDEGVLLANQTEYGLGNSVWTRDLARAQRVAEAFTAGNGWINAHNVVTLGVPYAGINKSGMGGGVCSIETLMDYYRPISVVRPL
jgi:acyl-CoA reductase-like NAD-dependent aldehyde dehydrogenase